MTTQDAIGSLSKFSDKLGNGEEYRRAHSLMQVLLEQATEFEALIYSLEGLREFDQRDGGWAINRQKSLVRVEEIKVSMLKRHIRDLETQKANAGKSQLEQVTAQADYNVQWAMKKVEAIRALLSQPVVQPARTSDATVSVVTS